MIKVGDVIKTDDDNFLGIVLNDTRLLTTGVLQVQCIINNGKFYEPNNDGYTYIWEKSKLFSIINFESESEKLAFLLKHL